MLAAVLALLALARETRADWKDVEAQFEAAQKDPDWTKRKLGYELVRSEDGAEAVYATLTAMAREEHPAVGFAGTKTLLSFRSPEAIAAIVERARKGKADEKVFAVLALEPRTGPPEVDALLLELAKANDPRLAAQAALALGASPRDGAEAALVPLLAHADWQVRAAAARSLGRLRAKDALAPLVKALDVAKGRDRAEVVAALQGVTSQTFGDDPAAWQALAGGADAATVARSPRLAPTVFGIPVHGQRVVVCLDNSLRMSEPHAFDNERLRQLCETKEGKPIVWFKAKTYGLLAGAHVKHLVTGLDKTTRLEVLTFNEVVTPLLGKLSPATSATQKTLLDAIDALVTDDGIATYTVLTQALDTPTPQNAWKSGPDEVVLITVNTPNKGEVTDPFAVADAVAWKARLRMVPIHTVGIGHHPYDLLRSIAERTGGTYVDLTK
jgi:hypothetical protein